MSMVYQVLVVAGQVLLLAVLLSLLAGRFVQDAHKRKIVVTVLLLLCMLLPVNGLTVAQWLRSVLGDLSVLTLVILANILAQRLFNVSLLKSLSRQTLLWGIVLAGVVFYPLALGVGPVDPYHFGYAPIWMGVLLALSSIFSWFTGLRDLSVVLLLPLLAFNLQMLESPNLWDYLLDPVLLVYALVQSALDFKAFWMRIGAKIS